MAIESFGSIDTSIYTRNIGQAQQSLVSGSRINQTADDPAGAAIVSALTADIRSDDVAIRNANTGINLLQTADGASTQINDQLLRLNDLSLQAQNGTYSDSQRDLLNQEFTQILDGIEQIAQTTQFNGVNLLNGDTANLDIALNEGTSSLTLPDLTLDTLGLTGLDLTTAANAGSAQTQIATALGTLSSAQGQFGAQQNGLTAAVEALSNQNLNQLSARSQISDTDFARAYGEQIRQQILNQASIAMQAQGNQDYKNTLALLS